jgi:hypothetical protein
MLTLALTDTLASATAEPPTKRAKSSPPPAIAEFRVLPAAAKFLVDSDIQAPCILFEGIT